MDPSIWQGLWILHSALYLYDPWSMNSSWGLRILAPALVCPKPVPSGACQLLNLLPGCFLSWDLPPSLHLLQTVPIWSVHKRFGEKSATISLLPSFEIRLLEIKGWKSDIFVFLPSTALSETKEIDDNPPCRNYGRSQMAFLETGSFFLSKIGKIKQFCIGLHPFLTLTHLHQQKGGISEYADLRNDDTSYSVEIFFL